MNYSNHKLEPSERELPLLDYSRYDRRHLFGPDEMVALEWLRQRFEQGTGNGPWPKNIQKALHSLLQPLGDAFDRMKMPRSVRSFARRIIFCEMIARETTFWAWGESEWKSLICANTAAFGQRYRTRGQFRKYFLPIAYLFSEITDLHIFGRFYQARMANHVFNPEIVKDSIARISGELIKWGYGKGRVVECIHGAVCETLLANRSPYLEDLTPAALDAVYHGAASKTLKACVVALSRVLVSFGILPAVFQPPATSTRERATKDVPPAWVEWCQRWRNTSTQAPRTREHNYHMLLCIGRWITRYHPETDSPDKWTRQTASAFVAAVNEARIGEWSNVGDFRPGIVGKPFTPGSKRGFLAVLRAFFRDCLEWEWISRKFDPDRVFATPKSIEALIAPNPRVLSDDIWAKLLWAGLNLAPEDVRPRNPPKQRINLRHGYPFEMIRALAIVWLFAGLRRDEICRLRVGCIRWQLPENCSDARRVCLLDVPTNKTGTAFTKPVDGAVGEVVRAWENVRPTQPEAVDLKTGEIVHYLFAYRSRRVGREYLNESVIPLLCGKAGIPVEDARGKITCHRARSTIATQLFNAKEPMSLFELQEWLGHRSPSSTQYYAKLTPTKLAKAYADADYFGRNIRAVEVLIDQEVIRNGAALTGEPWKYYDLGHGYCTYDFFDQCPHRMACAKCSFYVPKQSTQAQLLEAKTNLERMMQEIPLREEERAAVEDGVAAVEKLCARLLDTPTPAGPTPREIEEKMRRKLPILR